MDRRNFLQLTATTTGGLLLIPNFFSASPFLINGSTTENIVVFIQLNGGNDGLNTFVPFNDPLYYELRPTIGLQKADLLNRVGNIGFHPALKGISQISQNGDLSIIQNVGYPNPNRSHFRSQEIWQTGSDAHEIISHGWLGRFLDIQCNDEEFLGGLTVDNSENLALRSEGIHSITVKNFNQFKKGRSQEKELKLSDNPQLDFVRKIAYSSVQGREEIQKALSKTSQSQAYGGGRFGQNLRWIAQLIKGRLNSKIFYTSHNGYDTHRQQLGVHQRQLNQLDGGIYSFYKDLKAAGMIDRVTTVVFSEFGRRVKENGTGTDHGAAGPMMIIGGNNKNRVLGGSPDLTNLLKGDLKYKVDFRSVYATLLKEKFDFSASQIGIKEPIIKELF